MKKKIIEKRFRMYHVFLLNLSLVCFLNAQTYRTHELGNLGGDYVQAYDINEHLQIVGIASDDQGNMKAFIWENNSMQDLGTLGGDWAWAQGINNQGQIVGGAGHADGSTYACFWDGTQIINLGSFGGTYGEALAINESGQIVGYSLNESGARKAFLWENGVLKDLGTLGGANSMALDINDNGQIVGSAQTAGGDYHAFIYENGVMSDMGTLGGPSSEAWAINNLGQVVGTAAIDDNISQAFLWDGESMTDLGTLQGGSSIAKDINDSGVIVGASQVISQTSYLSNLLSETIQNNRPLISRNTHQSVASINQQPSLVSNDQAFIALFCSISMQYQLLSFASLAAGDYVSSMSQLSAINPLGAMIGYSCLMNNSFFIIPMIIRLHTIANQRNTCTNGDPVVMSTGELIRREQDLFLRNGKMPLQFSRYYHSMMARDGNYKSHLGTNWIHNFDMSLTLFEAGYVEIVFQRGQLLLFAHDGGNWLLKHPLSTTFQLREESGDFILFDPETNRQYIFEPVDGHLTRIEDKNGNKQILEYSGGKLMRVSGKYGRELTLTYDNNMLTSVSEDTRTIQYDHTGQNLTKVTDILGNETNYTYDTEHSFSGLITSVTLPEGNTPYVHTYDSKGRVSTQTTANGGIWTYAYESDETILDPLMAATTTVTDPLGNTSMYTHNTKGDNLTFTDGLSNIMSMVYDENGQLTQLTDREDGITTYTYDSACKQLSSFTDANGNQTTYQYQSRLCNAFTAYDHIRTNYADGAQISYDYDNKGNLVKIIDEDNNQWINTCNEFGQPTLLENPEGGIYQYIYNTVGNLESIEDPSGNITTIAYDGFNRPITITHADGTSRSFTYNDADYLISMTDENTNSSTFFYDKNGNRIQLTDNIGSIYTYEYDDMENMIQLIDPLSNTLNYQYDGLNRITHIQKSGQSISGYTYDAAGNRTMITDGMGSAWQYTYDAEHRLEGITDPLSNTLTLMRDDVGNLTQIISPLGNQSQIQYDVRNRPFSTQDPLGRITQTAYDIRGYISSITLPDGAIGQCSRNSLGKIILTTDPNGSVWYQTFDEQGRLLEQTDPLNRTAEFTYNNKNRISHIDFPNNMGYADYTYDGVGNFLSAVYSDGISLNYTYDDMNRLTQSDGITFTYDAAGRLTESNGIIITRDDQGRIEQLELESGKTIDYTYNARNLPITVTDWLGGTTTLDYDASGQLIEIERPNGTSTQWIYDANGKISEIKENGTTNILLERNVAGQVVEKTTETLFDSLSLPDTTQMEYDATSQISGYQYDDLGRLLQDADNTYQWNLKGCLTEISMNNESVYYTYDGFGNRLSRTENNINTEYVWNYALDLPSVSVTKKDNEDIRYDVHTPRGILLYSIDGGSEDCTFYHYDEMGNTSYLTDDNGETLVQYDYSPYGVLLVETDETIENPYTYQGMYGVMRESGNGLYYMRARYYDSGTARFITRDPVKTIEPRSINPYQYALNDPMLYTDPSGLFGIRIDQVSAQPLIPGPDLVGGTPFDWPSSEEGSSQGKESPPEPKDEEPPEEPPLDEHYMSLIRAGRLEEAIKYRQKKAVEEKKHASLQSKHAWLLMYDYQWPTPGGGTISSWEKMYRDTGVYGWGMPDVYTCGIPRR